ncbi:MAG: hypothetical protein WAU11_15065 [Ignavibacteriaceae bacterium]
MKKFAEIHLERLSANNGTAQFTAMITATTAAYTAYFGSITNEDTKYAIQQGLTMAMTNVVENFKKFVSKREGTVRGEFGADTPNYQEFFPQGVDEYWQANLANIETLLTRFAAAAERHSAELGATMQSDAENFLTDFKAARKAQLEKIGEVQAQKSTTSTNRDVIENELMKNVHLIASMFIGEVDRCMDFFDQSFIRSNGKDDEEEIPTDPTPPTE